MGRIASSREIKSQMVEPFKADLFINMIYYDLLIYSIWLIVLMYLKAGIKYI